MTATTNDIKDSPIAWFYTLENARRRNDFEQAARAKRELKRLGVEVRYAEQKKEGVKCSP